MRHVRIFLSASTVATLLTLVSVVTALAGDNTGPLPR